MDRDRDPDLADQADKDPKLRTAVVIVHGMGEHRPLETLNGFIEAGLPPVEGTRHFYSRPDGVTESYESRRYLAPRQPEHGAKPEVYAQTEFFEYHWAYLMQGNELGDLWSTVRKFLLLRIGYVPAGLLVVWVLAWLLIAPVRWGASRDRTEGSAIRSGLRSRVSARLANRHGKAHAKSPYRALGKGCGYGRAEPVRTQPERSHRGATKATSTRIRVAHTDPLALGQNRSG